MADDAVPESDGPGNDVPGDSVPGNDVPGNDVPGDDRLDMDVPGDDQPDDQIKKQWRVGGLQLSVDLPSGWVTKLRRLGARPPALDGGVLSGEPGSDRMRKFWRVGGSLLTVVVLVPVTLGAVSQVAHQEYTEHEVFPAAGITEVEIPNHAGRVDVTAGPPGTEDIRVTVEVSDGLQRTRHDRQVEDGRLRLAASCPILTSFCDVTYTVEMPADLDLTVRTSRHGRVDVRGLEGSVDVQAEGPVEAWELSGPVNLDSAFRTVEARRLTSAEVEVSAADRAYVELDEPPRHVSARVSWGGVDVVVPDDDSVYRIDAHADFGRVQASTLRTDPDSDRVIEAHGQFDVTIRHP